MSFAAVLILAVSLSMDALGIGISYGLRRIRVSWKARVVICAMSMMVTGAAVGLGSVLLEVTQIGKDCHSHCTIYYQMGKCIMPSNGIFARVLQEGEISVRDTIQVLPETGKVRKILCSGKAASNAESNFAETFGEAQKAGALKWPTAKGISKCGSVLRRMSWR